MFGKITKISGKKLEIELDEDIDMYRVQRLSDGKQPSVELTVQDGRHITPDQRGKIWALIHDFSEFTGDPIEYAEDMFKSLTRSKYGLEEFSLSDCSIETATLMIEAILEFMFEHDIPFRTKVWDSIPDYFPKQMLCLMNKRCVLCGKPADIAHFNAVGMGRSRRKINHVGMYIMTLCRSHHTEQHKIGINNFIKKYHIKPIKVTKEIAKRLRLHSKEASNGDSEKEV